MSSRRDPVHTREKESRASAEEEAAVSTRWPAPFRERQAFTSIEHPRTDMGSAGGFSSFGCRPPRRPASLRRRGRLTPAAGQHEFRRSGIGTAAERLSAGREGGRSAADRRSPPCGTSPAGRLGSRPGRPAAGRPAAGRPEAGRPAAGRPAAGRPARGNDGAACPRHRSSAERRQVGHEAQLRFLSEKEPPDDGAARRRGCNRSDGVSEGSSPTRSGARLSEAGRAAGEPYASSAAARRQATS